MADTRSKRLTTAQQNTYNNVIGSVPATGVGGLSPEEVLKHLIVLHSNEAGPISTDLMRWHDGLLELNVWQTVGDKKPEPEARDHRGGKGHAGSGSPAGAGRGRSTAQSGGKPGGGPRGGAPGAGRGASVPSASTKDKAAPAPPAAATASPAGDGDVDHSADNTTAATAEAPVAVEAAAPRSKSSAAAARPGGRSGKPAGGKHAEASAAPGKAWGHSGSLQAALKHKEDEAAEAAVIAAAVAAAAAAAARPAGSSPDRSGENKLNNVRRHGKRGGAAAPEGVPPTGGDATDAPAAEAPAPQPATEESAASTSASRKPNAVWGARSGVAAIKEGKVAPPHQPAHAEPAAAAFVEPEQNTSEQESFVPAAIDEPAPIAQPEHTLVAPEVHPAPAFAAPALVAPARVNLGRFGDASGSESITFGVPTGGAAPETNLASISLNSLGLGLASNSPAPLHVADLERQQLAAAEAAHKEHHAPAAVAPAPAVPAPVAPSHVEESLPAIAPVPAPAEHAYAAGPTGAEAEPQAHSGRDGKSGPRGKGERKPREPKPVNATVGAPGMGPGPAASGALQPGAGMFGAAALQQQALAMHQQQQMMQAMFSNPQQLMALYSMFGQMPFPYMMGGYPGFGGVADPSAYAAASGAAAGLTGFPGAAPSFGLPQSSGMFGTDFLGGAGGVTGGAYGVGGASGGGAPAPGTGGISGGFPGQAGYTPDLYSSGAIPGSFGAFGAQAAGGFPAGFPPTGVPGHGGSRGAPPGSFGGFTGGFAPGAGVPGGFDHGGAPTGLPAGFDGSFGAHAAHGHHLGGHKAGGPSGAPEAPAASQYGGGFGAPLGQQGWPGYSFGGK